MRVPRLAPRQIYEVLATYVEPPDDFWQDLTDEQLKAARQYAADLQLFQYPYRERRTLEHDNPRVVLIRIMTEQARRRERAESES